MYIVYETTDAIEILRSKYLVLELDTLEFSDGKTVRAFAVVDSDNIAFQELQLLESLSDLHSKLLENYRKQNWNYCKQAIDHLMGSFKGELDTFYDEFSNRIAGLEGATLAEDWTGNIITDQTEPF